MPGEAQGSPPGPPARGSPVGQGGPGGPGREEEDEDEDKEEEEEEGGEGGLPPPALLSHALLRRPLTSEGERRPRAGRCPARAGSGRLLLLLLSPPMVRSKGPRGTGGHRPAAARLPQHRGRPGPRGQGRVHLPRGAKEGARGCPGERGCGADPWLPRRAPGSPREGGWGCGDEAGCARPPCRAGQTHRRPVCLAPPPAAEDAFEPRRTPEET